MPAPSLASFLASFVPACGLFQSRSSASPHQACWRLLCPAAACCAPAAASSPAGKSMTVHHAPVYTCPHPFTQRRGAQLQRRHHTPRRPDRPAARCGRCLRMHRGEPLCPWAFGSKCEEHFNDIRVTQCDAQVAVPAVLRRARHAWVCSARLAPHVPVACHTGSRSN